MTDPKTISEAIDSVTDDDIDLEADGDEVAEGEATEGEEKEGTLLDEEDEEEAEEEAEEEGEGEARTGDVQGEEEEEGEGAEAPAATDESDIFDALSAEEIAAIKADPALNKLRKSLMRGFSTKTSEHNQLVQLGLAYKRDPQGVAKAIAESVGLTLAPAPAAAAPAAPAAAVDPGIELEQLFGPQIGPKVRAVFDKWAEARIGPRVAPLEQSLNKVTADGEAARMYGEEQAFKARHKDITPDVEKAIVELGSSGKIVPGNMTPAEYLETLYDVVSARRARIAAKGVAGTATKKLAAKIAANRRDREPVGVSGRGGAVKKVSRISEAKNISEALDFAMAELESEGR